MKTLAAGFVLAFAVVASAHDPEWSGLGAVAASPDGKIVACGGENRVLYVLDAASHEVRQRIWMQARVGALAFSKDGSRLCLEDDDEILHILDTATWKETAKVEAAECAFAPAADLLVAISYKQKGVVFLSMTDGSSKGSAAIEGRIQAVGIDAAGAKAVVMLEPADDASEKKQDYSAMPKDLKGLEQKEWQLRNDGKVCALKWLDSPSGKVTAEAKTWYSIYAKGRLSLNGDTAVYEVYEDANAKITPKGEATIFPISGSYNYGRGGSADGRTAIGGSLRGGAFSPVDGGAMVKFEVEKMPGWPEYWAGFAPAGDGAWWGVTSASRLVKIGKDGKIDWAGPVY